MQKARGHPCFHPKKKARLPLLVGTWFQDLFHPPPGVLFTFPSRYSFAIGHGLVFSLGRWSCQLQSGFLVSRPTQERFRARAISFVYGAVTLYGLTFQTDSTHRHTHTESQQTLTNRPTTPRKQRLPPWHLRGLGYSPFARRYSGNHGCFLFLEVLRCFSSLGSLSKAYVFSQGMTGHHPSRVSPFGNPGINACLQLPLAYRSLPRPSSPVHA
jgi:hypothetical protein